MDSRRPRSHSIGPVSAVRRNRESALASIARTLCAGGSSPVDGGALSLEVNALLADHRSARKTSGFDARFSCKDGHDFIRPPGRQLIPGTCFLVGRQNR